MNVTGTRNTTIQSTPISGRQPTTMQRPPRTISRPETMMATFPAGTHLDATFRFDSYRLTWRRKLVSRDDLDVWLGLSGNIRDAEISVEGGGQRATKANTGFVPLINFLIDWRFAKPWSLRAAGDALVGPQGRAEDVLLALLYDASASTTLFAGYRILEGGADNDEVYTFSLFHYAVAGIEVRL